MGCGCRLFLWVALFFLCFLSSQVKAVPAFSHHKVNGYDVYLIDIGRGNRASLQILSKNGFWHDGVYRRQGLSHLLEHMMHNGSVRFPGRETLRKVMDSL